MASKKRDLPHPIINTLITEWKFLGNRRRAFAVYMAFFVVAGLISLITPFLIGTIFNDIQQSITSQQELTDLHIKITLLLVLTVLFWIFHGLGRVMEQKTGFFVRRNYVNDKIHKVLELPIRWHKDHHSGDTIDKINRAGSSLEDFSGHVTFQIAYGIVNFFGSIIIMFFIDWTIGLFVLLFSSITIFAISRIDKNLEKKYEDLNRYNNRYSATVFDYLSNVSTIITLRLKKMVSREINAKQMASYSTFRKTVAIDESKWALSSIAIRAMIVIALIYRSSTEFALTGTILVGTLYMIYGYLTQVGDTFYKFAELYGNIIRSNARIVGAYPLDEAYRHVKKKEVSRLPKNWRKIELKDVSFTYDQKGRIRHIDNINFQFARGQKIALVGESGSGKSTILTLVRGLYDIEKGEIYCNGKPLRNGLANVREHVTLVPQEPEIFNKTFRYNVTMNLPVSENEIRKVVEMAQLRQVIEKLPRGLDTNVLEKGVSLSGGEKQRLALARGLLAASDSEILLLDEPTSSVDSLNEIKIHDNIFGRFKDKTIISSIHRLHLLDKFDYIYLLSKGRIVGEGTFEQLKQNKKFRRMWAKYSKEKQRDRKLMKKR